MGNRPPAAWILTILVALILTASTVALAVRERSIPKPPGELVESSLAAESTTVEPDSQDRPDAAANLGLRNVANGQIAFVSDRDGNEEIYVMQPNGGNQRRISDHPGADTSPTWSADGTVLAWARIEDSNGDGTFGDAADTFSIHVAQADGSNQRLVFSGSGGWVRSAGATADISQVALYAVMDADEDDVISDGDQHYLLLLTTNQVNASLSDLVDLLAPLEGYEVSPLQANLDILWTPDNQTVYVMLQGPDGVGLYALGLDGSPPVMVAEGTLLQVALSPDGTQMAYWREVEDSGRRRRRMMHKDLETGLEGTLLMGGLGLRFVDRLAWSNDASRLLFMGGTGNSAPEIYSLNVGEDTLTSLTQRIVDPAFTPAWSPDGRHAVFVVQEFRASSGDFVPAGDSNLFVADDIGSSTEQLTENMGNNGQPAWQPLY
jgi:Tol biopolymer transport system component